MHKRIGYLIVAVAAAVMLYRSIQMWQWMQVYEYQTVIEYVAMYWRMTASVAALIPVGFLTINVGAFNADNN